MNRTVGSLLVATDFAAHSREAVARAAWLPLARGASITLLHVVPVGLPDDIVARLRAIAAALMAAAESSLAAELRRAGRGDAEVYTAITTGSAAETIIERAHHARVALVIAGRGQRRSLGERLLGSTAERIVRGCDADVSICPRSRTARSTQRCGSRPRPASCRCCSATTRPISRCSKRAA